MNKPEFLENLKQKLKALPKENTDERLNFYSEMIDDLTEEGMSEEEAVKKMGDTDKIAAHIIADWQTASAKSKKKSSAGKIAFIALSSPIWLVLLISAALVVLSLYISLWAILISLWAVFGSLAASAVAFLLGGIYFICTGFTLSGLALAGAALVCAGLSVLLFFGCKAATQGTVFHTKKIALKIKCKLTKKEAVI